MAVTPQQRKALHSLLSRSRVTAASSQVLAAFETELERVNWTQPAQIDPNELNQLGTFLREHAGQEDASVLNHWSAEAEDDLRLALAASKTVHLFELTLSPDEVANAIGIDSDDLHLLAAKERLQEIDLAGPRYPSWQIGRGRLVPGLSALVPVVLRSGVAPDTIAAVMTSSTDELAGQTPVDYLQQGGEASLVAAVIEGLARA